MTNPIVHAAHTLRQQLEAFVKMVENRETALKQPWVDTTPQATESEARARLKVWQDKWSREKL